MEQDTILQDVAGNAPSRVHNAVGKSSGTKNKGQSRDDSDKNASRGTFGKQQRGMPFRLQAASFLSGAAVMVMELAGSRLTAPFFGTSLIVWTAIIGVIMTSLCIGNWLGGHIADKYPSARTLGHIFTASAVVIAVTGFSCSAVFSYLSSLSMSLYIMSVTASLAVFAPSSLLLGMVSPFIARLAMRDVASSGTTVGRLSALNSAGSILGTFLGGFVLISLFPSHMILMMVAAVLAFLALLVYSGAPRGCAAAVLFIIAAEYWAAGAFGIPGRLVGEQIDTRYNHISIAESTMRGGRRVRIMITDPNGAQSLMYPDSPEELVSDYTKFYDLAFHFRPNTSKILMLGGGGYCVPRWTLSRRDVSFDVVEIDPGITEAAVKYFSLNDKDPNIRIFHEGARAFLNRAGRDGLGPYDAVFMDVFGSWYSIPFQVATVEAAERIRSLMTPDGVLVINVISSLEGPRSGVFHGIYSAFSRSFPQMMIFQASAAGKRYAHSRQNLMIVALCSDDMDDVPPVPDSHVIPLLANRWTEPFNPSVDAFTDAFAPVEMYALRTADGSLE